MKYRPIHGSLAAAITLTMLLLVQSASADEREGARDGGAAVLANREVREKTGKTIAQWGARWWQWAFQNPEVLGDTTGEFGYLGDVGGPVFFAEGSNGDPVNLSYEVPGGKYILLPVATYIWTFFDPCADVDCAREIVNHNFLEGITYVNVKIDGERVRNIAAYMVPVDETKPVVFKVDAGPIDADGYGGILKAVQSGYWVMLKPLPPGKHRISMFATVPNIDGLTGELAGGYTDLDARLKLQVR
jgi:hypothetical protein